MSDTAIPSSADGPVRPNGMAFVALVPPAKVIGLGAGLLSAGMFALGAVVLRTLARGGHPPADLVYLRYLGFFLAALIARAVLGPAPKGSLTAWRLAVLLILAGPPYHLIVTAAYPWATAAQVSILLAAFVPIASVGLAGLAGTPISGLVVAGLAIAILGLGIESWSAIAPPALQVFALTALAALAFALFNALAQRWRLDPLRTTVALGLASPVFLPVYLIVRPPVAPPAGVDELAMQLIVNGIGTGFLALLLNLIAVSAAGSAIAGAMQALTPGAVAFLAAVLIDETPSPLEAAGAAVTVVGILVLVLAKRR